MANPAELLHSLFTSWNLDTSSSVANVRNDPGLKEHRRAVIYLDSIEKLLGQMESDGKRTTVWRKHFPTWVKIVFNYPNQWQQSNKGTMSGIAIDHLETLIDYAEDYSPKIEVEKLPLLALYIEAVRIALVDDDSLPTDVKHVALRVLSNVESMLDEIDQVDSVDFEKAILELLSVLAVTVIRSKNQGRWEGWTSAFVWPFMYDTAKAGAKTVWELLQSQDIPLMLGQ